MSGLIRADTNPPAATFTNRLTAKARRLASARAESRVLSQSSDEARWRKARLLWPLFGKG